MGFKDHLIIGGVVLALPIGIAVYSTFASVATAPSRVINKTLETGNIISNYEFFRDANNQVKSRVGQIKEYGKILSEETNPAEKSRLRVELSAIKQSCRDLAAKYNANSAKLNRAVFKGSDVPDEIALTTCE